MELHEFHLITILIGLLLVLIILLVICQCILPCCGRPNAKDDSLGNDQRYYQNIQSLLERQQLVERQREEHAKAAELLNESLYSIPSPYRAQSRSPPQYRRASSRTSSRSPPTRRPGSRSSSLAKPETIERLSKLKEELEQYRVDHSIKIRLEEPNLDERRRTWGGLNEDYRVDDETFQPVTLPNVASVSVQTTYVCQKNVSKMPYSTVTAH